MNLKERHKKYLKALGITTLAFLLSQVLLSPLTFSAATMISSPDRGDFTINDFYSHVADKRAVRTLDSDVVIVDIGDLDRDGIADVLDMVSLCSPRAVGVDVLFAEPHEDDSNIINALRGCPNIVMAASVKPDSSAKDRFTLDLTSFLMDSLAPGIPVGATNFPTVEGDRTIREFRPAYPGRTDSIASFALAITEIAAPDRAAALMKRDNPEEVINFCSRTYKIYTPDEIAGNAGELIGKIVLLGSLSQREDMHTTPVKASMTGVMIHAHTISTILSGHYFYKLGKWWNWAIAFILCFMVVSFSMFIPAKIKSMSMRVFQLILLYVTIRYGYDLFINYSLIVNFSYSLLMITFGLLANDFWTGAEAAVAWIKHKFPIPNLKKVKFLLSR